MDACASETAFNRLAIRSQETATTRRIMRSGAAGGGVTPKVLHWLIGLHFECERCLLCTRRCIWIDTDGATDWNICHTSVFFVRCSCACVTYSPHFFAQTIRATFTHGYALRVRSFMRWLADRCYQTARRVILGAVLVHASQTARSVGEVL